MADSFKGSRKILLQTGDTNQSYTFTVTVCSSQNSNDGFLSFGRSIVSVDCQCFDADGTNVTSVMLTSCQENDNVIQAVLNYPGSNGQFSLRFMLTLDDASVVRCVFNRCFAESGGY